MDSVARAPTGRRGIAAILALVMALALAPSANAADDPSDPAARPSVIVVLDLTLGGVTLKDPVLPTGALIVMDSWTCPVDWAGRPVLGEDGVPTGTPDDDCTGIELMYEVSGPAEPIARVDPVSGVRVNLETLAPGTFVLLGSPAGSTTGAVAGIPFQVVAELGPTVGRLHFTRDRFIDGPVEDADGVRPLTPEEVARVGDLQKQIRELQAEADDIDLRFTTPAELARHRRLEDEIRELDQELDDAIPREARVRVAGIDLEQPDPADVAEDEFGPILPDVIATVVSRAPTGGVLDSRRIALQRSLDGTALSNVDLVFIDPNTRPAEAMVEFGRFRGTVFMLGRPDGTIEALAQGVEPARGAVTE